MTEKDLEIQQLRAELKRYKDAEVDGRLVFLNGVTISDLKRSCYSAEIMLEDMPSSSYTTGFIKGFGEGQLSILEKLLPTEKGETI